MSDYAGSKCCQPDLTIIVCFYFPNAASSGLGFIRDVSWRHLLNRKNLNLWFTWMIEQSQSTQLAPPGGLAPPPTGNPGSAPATPQFLFKVYRSIHAKRKWNRKWKRSKNKRQTCNKIFTFHIRFRFVWTQLNRIIMIKRHFGLSWLRYESRNREWKAMVSRHFSQCT